MKNKKRKILVGIIVLVIIIFIIGAVRRNRDNNDTTIETESIEKRTLVSSISATGVIASSETKDIITTLTGVQINTVNIKEGDVVSVGDVICTFDTENIQKNLKTAQKDLNATNAQANLSVENARRNLADAINSKDYVLSNSEKEVNKAKENYDSANSELEEKKSNLESKKAEEENLKQVYESTKAEDSTYISAKEAYEKVKLEREGLESAISTLQSNVNDLFDLYQATLNTHENNKKVQNSSVASAQSSIKSAELSATTSGSAQQTQINNYKEQLEKGVLTATTAGVVTSVNVNEGDVYTGTPIATIEGSEDLIIETEINEYDISDIQVGMKVIVKTDATREEELKGTVVYASPKATQNSMGTTGAVATSTGVTYTVKIALETPNDRLRLGMTARLSIITESREDVYSVPYDAIHENDNGEKMIYVVHGDSEEARELVVSIGMESNYYVEIQSDEINQDMKVVLPTVKGDNSLENLMVNMGPRGGF